MKRNDLKDKINDIKAQPFALMMILLYVLPPIGVAGLAWIGFKQLYKSLSHEKNIPLNMITYFFTALFVTSLMATVENHAWLYSYVPFMIIGYYGVYLYTNVKPFDMVQFKWIVICGGVYIVCIDKFMRALNDMGIDFGYLNYLFGSALIGIKPTERLFGSAYNPNLADVLLLLSLAVLYSNLLNDLHSKAFYKLFYAVPMIGILMVGITETGSRSGFISMLILTAIFIMMYYWRSIYLIGISLIVMFNKIYDIMPRHQLIIKSIHNRLEIWTTSIKIFLAHPVVGVGPGYFKSIYETYTGKLIAHPHNLLLAFFAEYGIVGGIAFLVLILYTIKKWLHLFKNSKTQNQSYIFYLTFPVILLTNLLDFPLCSPQVGMPVLILLSLFYQHINQVELNEHSPQNNTNHVLLMKRKTETA
ncbi:membrane protein [Pullulanibacillus camelliae]|uniref:Membrane protein n=1 Tax=Pullulanibacillus camelliae TaxID=1707096 RepID=A0A8J2YLF4_9BACL|nr:O-antigen ligase family protein [Pullulanibacillus camelliae]GGE50832.1 membrane protein [Pullulanibacillus camelliae]